MPRMSVLVSGASIAGPALAFWLSRYGISTTVVESAPSLRPGGQAVDVRGVAKEVIKKMGLAEEVRAACTSTAGLSFVNRTNRRLATVRAEHFGGDGPIAEIEILRGDLSQVLYEATKDDTEYLFGDRITGLDQREDGVQVSFESGLTRSFDVVIGADGLHSSLRATIFGEQSRFLHHLGVYMSFWTTDNHLGLENWAVLYNEPGRMAGVRAIHRNQAAMAIVAFRANQIEYDYRDVNQQKALVRTLMAGVGWETERLINQMGSAPDFYFDSCSQVLMDTWSRGRIGLLGDAAFCASPLSGQGTSLALVGAYVLAGELASAGRDPARGLAAYERRMRDWVLATQRFGRTSARNAIPNTRVSLWARTQALRILPHLPGNRILLRSQLKVFNGFDLPDYSHLRAGHTG